MKKTITFSLIITVLMSIINFSCLKTKREGIPEGVRRVLELSGIHKQQLLMALEPYYTAGDSAKLKSLFWLIENMEANYFVSYHIEDSSGNIYYFNPEKYKNYLQLKHHRDSVEQIAGNLIYEPDTFIVDYETVTKDFLIDNLEQAYNSVKRYPWAENYTIEMFNEWILPYRCANERIEPFRRHFLEKFGKITDTLQNENPLAVAKLLNDLINAEIDYSDTYNISANIQPIDTLEKYGHGNFFDIAVYKVKALRSFGIAAALDYVPYFADTNYGCAWATAFDNQGGEYYLFPKTSVRNPFKRGRIPKMYRRTFKTLKNSLRAIKNVKTNTPPYLGHYDYYDITNSLESVDVSVKADTDTTKFVYLAVFNDGEWHPVDWAKTDSAGLARFQKIMPEIIYLPLKMIKAKQYRLDYPFLLENGGMKRFLIPDYNHPVSVTLRKTAPYVDLTVGEYYSLYVWDGNWTPLYRFYCISPSVMFNLPQNALFLLANDDIDFDERIFIPGPTGEQIFK